MPVSFWFTALKNPCRGRNPELCQCSIANAQYSMLNEVPHPPPDYSPPANPGNRRRLSSKKQCQMKNAQYSMLNESRADTPQPLL